MTKFLGRTLHAVVRIERTHRDGPRAMNAGERARAQELAAEGGEHYVNGRDATIRMRCRARVDGETPR